MLLDDAALAHKAMEDGATLAAAERWNAALERFDESVRRNPSCAAAHEQRAQVLMMLDDRAFDAVQAAQRACDNDEAWGDARLTLARAQLALGEITLALANVERALSLGCQEAQEDELEIEGLLMRCAIRSAGGASADIARAARAARIQS